MEETKEERRARKERERAERKKNETEEERRARKERERAERKAREAAAAIEAAAHEDTTLAGSPAPPPAKKAKEEDEKESKKKKSTTTTSTAVGGGAVTKAGEGASTSVTTAATTTTSSHHKHRENETEEERRARKERERAERKAREQQQQQQQEGAASAGGEQGTRSKDAAPVVAAGKEGGVEAKPKSRKPANETEEERRVRKERERAERKAREAAAKAQQQEEQDEEEEKSKGAQGGDKSSKHAKDDEKKAPRVKAAAAAQEAKGEGGEGAAGAERTSSKDQQHPHHHHHTSHSNNNTNSATEENTSESRATAALREAIAAENEAALSRKTSAGLPSTRPPTQGTEHRTDSAAQGAQGRKTMTSGGGGSSRPASRPGLSLVRPSVSSLSGITNVEELRRQAYRTQFAHDLARATALRRLVDLDDVAVVLVDFAPQSAYERYLQRLSFAEAHRSPATTSALPHTLQGKDAHTSRNEEEGEGERARGGAVPCQVAVQCPGEESRVDVAVQAVRTRLRSHGVQAPDDLGLYPEGLQDATLALSALLRKRRNGSEDEDDEDEEENKSESDGERGDGNESRSVKARQAGKNAAEKMRQQKKNTTTSTTTAAGTTIATLSRFLDRVMPVMEAVLDEGDALAQARHAHGEGQTQSNAPQESTTRTAFSSLAGSLQCNLLTHYSVNKGGEEGSKSDSIGALYVRPVRALSYHAASPHLLLALYGPFTLTSSSSSQENKTQTNGDVSLLPGSQYASLVLIWDTRSARNTSHRPHTNTPSSSSSSTLGVSVLPRHVLASDETLTCVTSSAARPHLIYAGTASGAVVVWDLRESDRLHETCGGGVCFSSSYVAGKEGTRGANIPVPHLPSYSSSWLAVDEPGSNGSGGSSNAITTNTAHTSRHNNNNNTEEDDDDDDDGEEDDGGAGNAAGGRYYAGLRTIAPMRKLVVLGHNSVTKAALRDLLTNNNSAAAAALLDSSVAMAGGMSSGPAALEEAEQLVSLDASGQLRFWRVQEQESLRNTIAESDYAMRPFSVVRLHLMSRMQLRPEFGAGMDWMGGGAGGGGSGALSVSAARMMRGQDAGEIEEAYNADDDEEDEDEDEGKAFAPRGGHVVRRAGPRRGGHRKGSSHGGYLSDSLEHTSHSSGEDEHRGGGRGRRKQQQRWLNVIGGTEAYDVDCMPTDATHLLVCLPDAVHHVSQFTSLTAPALYRPCTSMEVTTLSSGLPTMSANTPHGVGSGGEACYDGLRQTGLAAWLPAPRCLTCNAQDSRVWLVGYEDGTVRLYVAAEPMPMLTVVVSEQPIVQVMSYAVVHTAHHTLTSKAEAEAAGGNRSVLDENSMSGPLGLGENRGVNPNANAVSSYTSTTTTTAASSTRWLSWALDADGAVFLLDHAHVNRTTPRVREPLQAQREMCGKCLCLATPPAMRGAFTESTHSSAVTRTGNEKNNTTMTTGGSNSSSTTTTMLALGYEKGVVQLHVVDHSPWLSNAAERDEQWL